MIGVAILGSGIFVKEQHIPAVLQCKDIVLKAIYSRSLASAQSTATLVPSSPDLYSEDSQPLSALLSRSDIHAVIVALPIVAQPEFVKAALDAGKHVLAEKPIAKDVATARELIAYAKAAESKNGATLAIAENMRFYPSFTFARDSAADFGRVTHFSVRVFNLMAQEAKWWNTEWRKNPEYQGGFLLDGGAHYAAATRMLLRGEESTPATVQARSDLVREHLPPIDSVTAIIATKSGAIGSYQHSAGSNLSLFDWDVGYEKGAVKVVGEKVTVTPVGGEAVTKEFPRTWGVLEEVAAWTAAIESGLKNELQAPEEALADLEFLEKLFLSGEKNGELQTYEHQITTKLK